MSLLGSCATLSLPVIALNIPKRFERENAHSVYFLRFSADLGAQNQVQGLTLAEMRPTFDIPVSKKIEKANWPI